MRRLWKIVKAEDEKGEKSRVVAWVEELLH
jgi:hypothetical protein